MRKVYLQKDKQFLDLIFLTILAIFSEVAGNGLLKIFPDVGYKLSLAPLIYLLALMRWGEIGGVVGVISGITVSFFLDNNLPVNLAMQTIPKLLLLLPFIFFSGNLRDKIGRNKNFLIGTIIGSYGVLSIGAGGVIFILNGSFLAGVVDSFFPQLLDLMISVIIISLIREQNLIFQDMTKYLEPIGERKENKIWKTLAR